MLSYYVTIKKPRHCEACSEANDEATQQCHGFSGLLRRSLRYTPRNDVQKKQDNPKLKRHIKNSAALREMRAMQILQILPKK